MKKQIGILLATVLAVASLSACSNATEETAPAAVEEAAAEEVVTEEAVTEEAVAEEAVAEDKGIITVAASATPHSEILEQAKSILAQQG